MTTDNIETISATHVRVCELASGGMGRVDLAIRQHGDFRRLYAVKRLHPHLRDDADLRAMFLDEARLAGLLQHPNVVSVVDVGQDDEGPLLVMEYVDGLSLSKLLSLANHEDELLPVQAVLRIAIDIAKGLHAAHELRGHDHKPLELVHRDLSPQNVLIDWNGNVRLTDFGIAKALGQSTKTATGVVKGKLSYLSPEQLRYEDIDRRSDLFALGIVIFEMLAGRRLYKNRDVEGPNALQRILHEPPPDVGEDRPETPPAVVDLLFRLLSKTPDERPDTADDVRRVLEDALSTLRREEPVLELGAVLDELGGELRQQKSAELGAAIDAASRTPTPVRRRRGRALQVVAGLGFLALLSIGAWQLGRASVDPPVASALETEAGTGTAAEADAEAEAEAEAEGDADADADAEAEAEVDAEGDAEAEGDSDADAVVVESPPRMRVRMRPAMRVVDMSSEMVSSDRWDDWE